MGRNNRQGLYIFLHHFSLLTSLKFAEYICIGVVIMKRRLLISLSFILIVATGLFFFILSTNHTEPVSQHKIEQSEDSRSEEHTSELQSRFDIVCRLLL